MSNFAESKINMSVVPREIDNKDQWKKHQRLKPLVLEEYKSFAEFMAAEMSKGHGGFRTRPGVDKYRFANSQSWFPKTKSDKISCGQSLAKALMLIPAIKERFFIKGYFNEAGSPENTSDMDMFELQIRDLIPKVVLASSAESPAIESVNVPKSGATTSGGAAKIGGGAAKIGGGAAKIGSTAKTNTKIAGV